MNKSNLLLSVIIPVYNSEKTLFNCINSVLSQNFSNFEIIVIDDGSTDNSFKIVEQFNSDKIKYIKIKNHGVAYARNLGIKISCGKYLTFIDSDDYINENYFESLQRIFEEDKFDVYLCGITIGNNQKFLNRNAGIQGYFEKQKLFTHYTDKIYNSGVFCLVTNKVYKRDIIIKNRINFPLKFTMGEDLNFNIQYFNFCKTFYFESNYYYAHIESESYLSKKFHKKYLLFSYKNVKLLCKLVNKLGLENDKLFKEYKKYIFSYTIKHYENQKINNKLVDKFKKILD